MNRPVANGTDTPIMVIPTASGEYTSHTSGEAVSTDNRNFVRFTIILC